jgi:hypothetical protein
MCGCGAGFGDDQQARSFSIQPMYEFRLAAFAGRESGKKPINVPGDP